MHTQPLLLLLVLVTLANGTPVLAKRLLGDRFAWPIDGGKCLPDGHPIFGHAKTFRGLLLAMVATAAVAPLLGFSWKIGLLVGTTAMAGDLISSFIKRRLALTPHSQALGLDQVPEVLLPLLACKTQLDLNLLDIVLGVVGFFIAELLLSRLLFRIGIRARPY